MIEGEGSAAMVQAWLARLRAPAALAIESMPIDAAAYSALATLVAAALAECQSLLIVVAGDDALVQLSSALELSLRPLCLALPTAEYAEDIVVRASLSLLKSRLARAANDSDGPIWAAQRQRLAQMNGLWQACLAWGNRARDGESYPEGYSQLFPVHILPSALAHRLVATADWVVIADATRHRNYVPAPWPGAQKTLLLGEIEPQSAAPPTLTDAAGCARAELELLAQELSDLELELATAQAEIADFTRRYHDLIGRRMTHLDALTAELAGRRAAANAEDLDASLAADTARSRAQRSRAEQRHFEELARPSERPFSPNGEIKKLYRTLAQRIHPDRARNEDDRAWRTQLMSEANRAYRANDQTALAELFSLWAEGPNGDGADRPDADSLERQTIQLKRRIGEVEAELNRLFASKLYELFTAANIARRTGRDLLQEMADRLDADIAAAELQLAT